MAHGDLLEILNYKLKTINYQLRGVMHGFVGTTEQLQEYLKMGFYIGFNGIIFKKIEPRSEKSSLLRGEGINFEELIKETLIEKILIETDCPYLTPPIRINPHLDPHKSVVIRNEPLNVKYVAEEIAKIKNLNYKEVIEITTQNAKELFQI